MDNIKIPAHYDGKQILLDEPIDLEPGTKLIVIIPDGDIDHAEWAKYSLEGASAAYSADEPEYPTEMIKEHNPEYEGR
ncbi:MAG: hypothetical protein AB7H86_05745 [Blastocatellales bacterium]